jgi:hypothetical protein
MRLRRDTRRRLDVSEDNAMMMCKFCHEPLTDALSGRLGNGLICRLNFKKTYGMHRGLIARACYDYEIVDGVVCIVDHDRGRSVTTDAAEIIGDLIADGVDLSICPVIYLDTSGTWDMLAVRDGRFSGFRSVNELDRDAAVKKAKALFARPDLLAASQLP